MEKSKIQNQAFSKSTKLYLGKQKVKHAAYTKEGLRI